MTLLAIARYLLGLIFLVFGLNGFFIFIPVPDFHPFMQLLVDSGYIYVIKAIEVASGIMLLTNRYVLVALVLLGADIVNIALYHLLFDPRNWPVVPVLLVLYGVLVWRYRTHFAGLLAPRPLPDQPA